MSIKPPKKNYTTKTKTKGLDLVKSCFPKEGGEIESHQLDALLKFLSLNPEKAFDVGRRISQEVEFRLQVLPSHSFSERFGSVLVAVDVLTAIIRECHSNQMSFYATSAVNILRDLFSVQPTRSNPTQAYNLKIVATQTFARLVKAKDGYDIEQSSDLRAFVGCFIEMINNNAANVEIKQTLRNYGIKGLLSYITTVGDIESFVAQFIDSVPPDANHHLINTLLNVLIDSEQEFPVPTEDDITSVVDNLSISTAFFSSQKSAEKTDLSKELSVPLLSFFCLRELGSHGSVTTHKSVFTSILYHINRNTLWNRQAFMRNVIRAMSHDEFIQTNSLQLLLQLSQVENFVPAPGQASVKNNIIIAINFFYSEEKTMRSISVGPMIEVLLPLIHELTHQAEINGRLKAPPPLSESERDLQENILHCIGTVAAKNPDPSEKVASIVYLIDDRAKNKEHQRYLLLRAVLEIIQQLKELPASGGLPTKVIDQLITFEPTGPEYRLVVASIFYHILRSQLSSGGPDEKGEKRNRSIRSYLLNELWFINSSPQNLMFVYKCFLSLLEVYGPAELEHSLPIMFHAEDLLLTDSTKRRIPLQMSQGVHSVVAAYLIQVARLINVPQLHSHVETAMNGKWSRHLFVREGVLVQEGDAFELQYAVPLGEDEGHYFTANRIVPIILNSPELNAALSPSLANAQVADMDALLRRPSQYATTPRKSSIPPKVDRGRTKTIDLPRDPSIDKNLKGWSYEDMLTRTHAQHSVPAEFLHNQKFGTMVRESELQGSGRYDAYTLVLGLLPEAELLPGSVVSRPPTLNHAALLLSSSTGSSVKRLPILQSSALFVEKSKKCGGSVAFVCTLVRLTGEVLYRYRAQTIRATSVLQPSHIEGLHTVGVGRRSRIFKFRTPMTTSNMLSRNLILLFIAAAAVATEPAVIVNSTNNACIRSGNGAGSHCSKGQYYDCCGCCTGGSFCAGPDESPRCCPANSAYCGCLNNQAGCYGSVFNNSQTNVAISDSFGACYDPSTGVCKSEVSKELWIVCPNGWDPCISYSYPTCCSPGTSCNAAATQQAGYPICSPNPVKRASASDTPCQTSTSNAAQPNCAASNAARDNKCCTGDGVGYSDGYYCGGAHQCLNGYCLLTGASGQNC
ncbi:hypothetical protein PROFUN_05623 [Planoprotostelium fungivorum]|uniref:Uncharacterized protein n=1 Tax=Planoprotostelium fungivorum TaxID=1890364 RepID=A0A2P6MUC5_9EUKA|nr:hypothetical protein PROFUN_05623 [Planoprotostelium fungivorum]